MMLLYTNYTISDQELDFQHQGQMIESVQQNKRVNIVGEEKEDRRDKVKRDLTLNIKT